MATMWAHVRGAVGRSPLLALPLILVALLLLASAVVLVPFAAPMAIGYVILKRSAPATGETNGTKMSTPVKETAAPVKTATVTSVKSSVTTSSPPEPSASAQAPLTGSAALMAKMRKSGAVTGEKRVKENTAGAGAKSGASNASTNNTYTNPSSRFFILFGGEASTQIARDIAEKATKRGLKPSVVAMDDFKGCDLDKSASIAIFVVETVENAQPAEAAGTCLRYFNRKRKAGEKSLLNGLLKYAVLGLGDTNLLLDRQTTTAKDCNQAAQTLDSALLFLGGEKLVIRGEANDAVGLEEAVEPWCETLWPALEKSMKSVESDGKKSDKDNASPASCVRFLYGSQTGNAAEICKAMSAEAVASKGFKNATCSSMNEVDVRDCLSPGNVLVYVVSSTGDGDAPDNCDAFFTRLKRAAKASPGEVGVGTQYCVLGLGDQNYSAFMAVPRSFSTAMEKAGATAFYKRGEADDTLGLYEYAEVWQDGLWGPLSKAVQDVPAFKAEPGKMAELVAQGKAKAKGETVKAKEVKETVKETEVVKETAPAKDSSKPSVPPHIEGIPALPVCRTEVVWREDGDGSDSTATYPIGTSNARPAGDATAFTASSPYLATVSSKELMTDPKSDRRVLHVEFDLTKADGKSVEYSPGDSIGVLPENDSTLVKKIAQRLNLDLNSQFDLKWAQGFQDSKSKPLPHILGNSTIKHVFTHSVDLTSPVRKSQLRVFAEFCDDADAGKQKLLTLCSKSGKKEYAAEIVSERPTLLEVLNMAPSCFSDNIKSNFGAFLDATSPLQPRMYSITTAPEASPNKPCVAFSVVRHKSPNGVEREGVATNWLDRLDNTNVPVFIKSSIHFKPPTDATVPTIMIGPGTGVAPFRGFLQRRKQQLRNLSDEESQKKGPCWLFFGCRLKEEDFLYRSDLEGFKSDGVLDELKCAFSREDPDKKTYVQHLIREHANAVGAIVANPKSKIFVCGDGGGMAKDVHSALVNSLVTTGMDTKQAEAVLMLMTKQGRYVRDIWS